jgi:hypothetical protein
LNDPSTEMRGFELSRIYGEGWNMAKKLLAAHKMDVDAPQAAARNPYHETEERSRWTMGFMEAVASRAGPFTTPGRNPWRASFAKRISAGE